MAKEVSKFPEVRRGRPVIYPYNKWFNGKKWALKQGEDFDVHPESFKAALYARKNSLGLEIRTSTVVDENGVATVYVQRLMGAVAQRKAAANKRRGRPKAKTAA